ncbi:MAG: hypothetical protein NZ932_01335 [Candidatus Bathyarchaeota archaeon]|nr:hypothetical protein [Candidatus Bathyarchaeota archaeon]
MPPRKTGWRKAERVVSLLLGLFLFFLIQFLQPPLSIFIYLLVFVRLFVAFIESALTVKQAGPEEKPDKGYYYYHRPRKLPWQFSVKMRAKLAVILFLAYLLAVSSFIVFAQIQRVSNAAYFNSFIHMGSGLPFNVEIPDGMVRLVTEELAVSIARRHMSEFGSNTQVLGCHITKTPEGNLVWVAVIGSTNVIAENFVKGFVIIDATEPLAPPKIVRKEFKVGEGLWFDRNIHYGSYMKDMFRSYGIAYVTWDFETKMPAYVITRYNVGFDLIRRYETPMVYDEEGSLYFRAETLQQTPFWITQVYDENWLEEMINEMGNFRRGGGFDYWAGGLLWFIPPSRERFEITEDTRYIVDPETGDVVALVCVNPIGNKRTLSGVFKATRSSIYFYDFRQANYISGMTAEDLVEGRLPKPATGLYYAEMPLLYPVQISPGNHRLAWYIPIYWREGTDEKDETIYLAGFAIVDAEETSKIAIKMHVEGMTSEQLVRATRLEFLKLYGVTTEIEVTAKVLGRYEFVEDGTTHIVLRLDNATYQWVEATPKDLPPLQWNKLMATDEGDTVTVHLERRGEKWIITAFENPRV